MKRLLGCLAVLITMCLPASAQVNQTTEETRTYHIGVFAPVYLDSVYTPGNSYRYAKNFPRFSFAGLDFLQGAQIALDSLSFPNSKIVSYFYDSQSSEFLSNLQNNSLPKFDLIISAVKDPEFTALANYALQLNIPYVSVTYPNDGGIKQNPFLLIVNSTLKAHCEAIFKYALQQFENKNIVFATKSGVQEDRVKNYFNNFNEPDGSPLMKMNFISLDNNFDALLPHLDSTKSNLIIGASLDENFAKQLAKQSMIWNKKYNITLLGMPNWETIFGLRNAKNNPNFPVYYTSAFYNEKDDEVYAMLENAYQQKFYTLPSEYAQKGFESVAMYVKLLIEHPDDFLSFINSKTNKVFSTYLFKPVKSNDEQTVPDYFENKHVIFMKSVNGRSTKAW